MTLGKNRRPVQFSIDRFWEDFLSFSKVGAMEDGALDRPFGSEGDLEARRWLEEAARRAGLRVEIDAVANLWAWLPGSGSESKAAIVIGSHHDSVPRGGRFDGALGVLAGLEALRAARESGVPWRHPLAMVSFTAEEPNPFDLSTLGSRTVAGRLSQEALLAAKDWEGRPLREAVAAAGGDLSRAAGARKSGRDIAVFLELHIEQGRRLELAGVPVGVVTGISGIYRESVVVRGEANHAGTTRREDRRDALLASAEMVLAFERAAAGMPGEDNAGTVGRFAISPNAVNIIPGVCEWVAELRARDSADILDARDRFASGIDRIAKARRVSVERRTLIDQPPALMDSEVRAACAEAAESLGIPYRPLFSMAGHDSTHIASFARAGMIFVPSLGGLSHCKEEESRREDIAAAGRVLVAALASLDERLP